MRSLLAFLMLAVLSVAARADSAGPAVLELEAWPGWEELDHAAARASFLDSCPAIERNAVSEEDAWLWACRVMNAGAILGLDARQEFERYFFAARLSGKGRTTAYYIPILEARRGPEGPFTAPLRGVPTDLVVYEEWTEGRKKTVTERRIFRAREDGEHVPYWSRADIEAGKADIAAPVLAWVRPEEKFFLQIQGSGHLRFDDGRMTRAAFGAHNGKAFSSIAGKLVRDGYLPRGRTGNDHIKAWIDSADPEVAQRVMNHNERYIFFRSEPIDGSGVKGALTTPLTGHVSIAVDPAFHRLGTMFLVAPQGNNAPAPRLAVAQDTGGAIKGRLRSDLYFGIGEDAGNAAEVVFHETAWWALIPRGSARERPALTRIAGAADSQTDVEDAPLP